MRTVSFDPPSAPASAPAPKLARRVDLNADVGEGFGRWVLGDDGALMSVITSANVACGYHAGDPRVMRSTCRLAAHHGVVVGAQVSYPDLAGFGRRFIDMSPAELTDAVLYQVGALEAIARASGTAVRYVKPHGALYNTIVHHERQAAAVVEAMMAHGGQLPLMGLPGSAVNHEADRRGIHFIAEGFADRAYTEEGLLVSRTDPAALLSDVAEVTVQAQRLAGFGVDSICVHGDTPGAAAMVVAVRAALEASGFELASFLD